MIRCDQCKHMATKTTEGAGQFLLWGCRKLKLTFGNTTDWRDKKKQPDDCESFTKKGVS